MSGPEWSWARRSEPEQARRREVEACLARWRLAGRPRRFTGSANEPEEAALGRRLRGALEELGPVGAAFGCYLASRVDLLPASDCVELAEIRATPAPLPAAVVGERIVAELGERAEELLAGLEPEPFETTLLVQSHRARLAGGQPAIVRLIRPAPGEPADPDLALLPLLAEALAVPGIPFERAVAEFRQELEQTADLRSAATTLEMLAVDAEMFGRLAVPLVDRGLTTSRVLTHTDLGGIALDEPFPGEAAVIARQVCVVWLRQALFGRVFPQELGTGAVRILPDGRIGLQGLSFVRVPAAVQANLRTFLIAVAGREPDEACAALIREMVREEGAVSEQELLLQLRQIVPFRDGSWSASGESLAEHAFVHGRLARSGGYRASLPALAFHRGLFAVALVGRKLVPMGDPLADGLQELRLLTGLSQMTGALRPDQWSGQLDRYALLMATLPQKIDELLLRVSAEDRRSPAEPSARPRGAGSSQVLVAAVALAAAALVLLLRHLAEAGVLAGRGERAGAILFLALGAWLLWALGRSR